MAQKEDYLLVTGIRPKSTQTADLKKKKNWFDDATRKHILTA